MKLAFAFGKICSFIFYIHVCLEKFGGGTYIPIYIYVHRSYFYLHFECQGHLTTVHTL